MMRQSFLSLFKRIPAASTAALTCVLLMTAPAGQASTAAEEAAIHIAQNTAGSAAQNTSERSTLSAIAALPWTHGPATVPATTRATIKISKGLSALDNKGTEKFLQLSGNLPDDEHYLIMDMKSPSQWWAVFSFDDIGYVKDDEKIDADALLKEMKDNDGPANEARAKAGLDAIYTDGWSTPPHYDSANKRLEWGLRLRDGQGNQNLNYTIRLLGRHGVVNATLVTDAESFDSDLKQFRKALEGFEFNAGEKYSEFTSGDKVAQAGLAALILGGAAAVATKKGWWAALLALLAKGWKLVLVGVAVVGAGIGKLFGRSSDK